MKIIKITTCVLGAAVALTFGSCGESYLDTEYTAYLDSGTASELIESDPDALSAYLNGIWSFMVSFNVQGSIEGNHHDFSYMSVLLATDVMGEDITFHNFHYFGYDYDFNYRDYNKLRTSVNWLTFYTMIAKSNEIIDLFTEEPITPEAKGILGQAYAIRGMSYYYLIQLYQQFMIDENTIAYDAPGVPMRYAASEKLTDEERTARTGRNTVKLVFEQIESDLTKSVDLLGAGYERPSTPSGKNYIDVNVANGLLARYYMLSRQWQKAADAANAARADYSMMDEKGLQDGFMDITNDEWMWGFNHNTETQTTYASYFSHLSNLSPGYAGLDLSGHDIATWLYAKMDTTDLRRKYWFNDELGSPQATEAASYPLAILKFGDDGNWTMDYPYMRAAEMVLIEAEAYAHMGDEAKAAQTLAILMAARDPQWHKASVTVEDVWIQRRIELIGEGFSYFDIKRLYKGIDRTKSTNHLVGYEKVVPAGDKLWTFQIPLREIQENDQISENEQNE